MQNLAQLYTASKHPNALVGKIRTDAPASPPEAVAVLVQLAASKRWRLYHGGVEAARLPELDDFPARPEGTILRARKTPYNLNDGPYQWNVEPFTSLTP